MNFNFVQRSSEALAGHPRRAAALIFVLALAPRVVMALRLPAAVLWPDGARYLLVADHLLAGAGFGSLGDNALSVPTQPVLLAAVRFVSSDSFLALRIFFAVIGAATCAAGYELTRRLFGPVSALLGGVGLALYPPLIYLSALFEYPQPFFMLLMALVFLAYEAFTRSRSISVLLLCGLCLGFAILTVPTVLLYVPLLLGCLLLEQRRRIWIYGPLLVLALSLPVAAWSLRNYAAYGTPILVNKAGGFNFWMANSETYYELGKIGVTPPCGRGYEQTTFCVQFRTLHQHLKSLHPTPDQLILQEDAGSWQNGLSFLRADLPRAAALTVRKFLLYWSPIPDAVHRGGSYEGKAAIWVAALSYLPVLVLGLIGLVLSRRHWRALLPVYAYFAVFMSAYSLFMPTTRYRLPLDFFLILFSAYTLGRLVGPDPKASP
ncbi:MAG TPA: glycosyltransferase family 39 protein [Steroidobacteraceae bacterium]|nr:glycosyltransferase family 39 protein [Steroidobacteraceae bacterium]